MREIFFAAPSADIDMSKYFEWLKSDLSLGEAALIALLGIVVVLAILFVLVGLLTAFEKIFSAVAKKSAKKKNQAEDSAIAMQSEQDEETVAAIVAAISLMYNEEQGSVPPFTVKRIRQVSKLTEKR